MGNLGDFDWTADLSLFDEQVYAESLHEVPQLPSAMPSLPGNLGGLSPGIGSGGGGSLLGGVGATGVGGLGMGGSGGASLLRGQGGGGPANRNRGAALQDLDDSFVVPDVSASNKRRRALA